jgi:hypothetical protein
MEDAFAQQAAMPSSKERRFHGIEGYAGDDQTGDVPSHALLLGFPPHMEALQSGFPGYKSSAIWSAGPDGIIPQRRRNYMHRPIALPSRETVVADQTCYKVHSSYSHLRSTHGKRIITP